MTVAELNEQLVAARKAYYEGTPTYSDAEYDSLECQLRAAVQAEPELASIATVLTTVGTDAPGRIPHAHPMRSIDNKYSEEEMALWADSIAAVVADTEGGGWPMMSLGSKWDGISGSLLYERGDLRKAVTRGDGEAGESVFAPVLATKSIPKTLPGPFSAEIRGEFVIEQSTMVLLNIDLEAKGKKPFTSTRNLVAGTMKLHDMAEVTRRDVQFRPWEVLVEGDFPLVDSAHGRLQDVSKWGFEPPDDVCVRSRKSLTIALEQCMARLAEPNQEVGRDGLVFKVDSFKYRKLLGVGSKFSNYQVCYKAQNSKAETYVLDVVWQVGRQGKLTPVAIIQPVVLAGAKIERATLNNISWINDLKVRKGSHVMVTRSGEVIPQITEVLDD